MEDMIHHRRVNYQRFCIPRIYFARGSSTSPLREISVHSDN